MPNEIGSSIVWLDKSFAAECGVSVRTLARWRQQGILNHTTGKRVKLRARQRGGRWVTTREWYDEFDNRLNGE
jgi:hypothetical protein